MNGRSLTFVRISVTGASPSLVVFVRVHDGDIDPKRPRSLEEPERTSRHGCEIACAPLRQEFVRSTRQKELGKV